MERKERRHHTRESRAASSLFSMQSTRDGIATASTAEPAVWFIADADTRIALHIVIKCPTFCEA